MASTFKTPGVYVEEISLFPPSVAQVETAIPAFIGYTQKAQEKEADDLIGKPTEINSLLEYVELFGTALDETVVVTITEGRANAKVDSPNAHNMYYAVQAFYANGGGKCYIVSAGLMSNPIVPAELSAALAQTDKVDEITLLVIPESLSVIDYAGLSADPATAMGDYKALMDDALARCAKLQDRFVVMDVPVAPDAQGNPEILDDAFRDNGVGINNLKYGAAYAPTVETIFNYAYSETSATVVIDGAAAVTLDSLNPANGGDSVAYNLSKAAIDRVPLVLPLSPIMVGIYTSVDNSRGVWKAPANVSLSSVTKPTVAITHDEQADLNVHSSGKSINAIRTFKGKGVLVWGARTLAGNDNEWRYISVRRFFNMVEESVKKATERFVFEPNDANTWVKVRGMIENFLLLQWRAGALAGAKPEHAFFVRVGLPETMTALDILEGRMNVEIGMAVVRPAEFIILKFSHKMQES